MVLQHVLFPIKTSKGYLQKQQVLIYAHSGDPLHRAGNFYPRRSLFRKQDLVCVMGQVAPARKRYIAAAIVVAAVASGIAILIALTQQERGVVIDASPLFQPSGSQAPVPGEDQATPAITVSPSVSSPGDQVTVQGTGFKPEEGVTVVIGNSVLKTTPPVVAADKAGNFSAAAAVPELPPDRYEVVATGEAGSSASEPMIIS
jgi:hypothetical protein